MTDPQWLQWSKRLQAIAQNGLTYVRDPFDRERYEQIQALAAEIAADHSRASHEQLAGLFAAESGHATPKIDVRALVFDATSVLLVKEKLDGKWSLPGGWVDVYDSPRSAVEREVREESGYIVRATRLLALHDRSRHPHPPHAYHSWKTYFLCEREGGKAETSIETSDVGFFDIDALPELSLGRSLPQHIQHFYQLSKHADAPAEFD